MNTGKTFVDGADRIDALLARPGMTGKIAEIDVRADEEDRS
ncbi:hypothetical protein [Frondihabitans australicus]|nr:hypothetical protein [Frondihabitans australicus]